MAKSLTQVDNQLITAYNMLEDTKRQRDSKRKKIKKLESERNRLAAKKDMYGQASYASNPSPVTARKTKSGIIVSAKVATLAAAKKLARKMGVRVGNPRSLASEGYVVYPGGHYEETLIEAKKTAKKVDQAVGRPVKIDRVADGKTVYVLR